jgi:hypothetical protein
VNFYLNYLKNEVYADFPMTILPPNLYLDETGPGAPEIFEPEIINTVVVMPVEIEWECVLVLGLGSLVEDGEGT